MLTLNLNYKEHTRTTIKTILTIMTERKEKNDFNHEYLAVKSV